MSTMEIDIGFANLIVEKYDSGCPNLEFIICLQDKQSKEIIQDIALIRKSESGNNIECLVWTDENDESYTHQFFIKRYLEKESVHE